MEVKIWPIDRLIPYARNPRKNDQAVDRMCAAIREFGFKIPCLVRSDGEVVDGHLRLKAAHKLGLKEIPVILCDEWTLVQVKAFRLLVNRSVGWAEWDEKLLAVELEEIQGLDFNLALTGFEVPEIETLLSQSDSKEEEFAPAPPEIATAQTGDLWELGNHLLFCGDATADVAYQRLLDGEMADMVFTDPPYNVDYRAPLAPDGSLRHAPITNDDLGGAFAGLMAGACRKMLDHTCGALYICMSSSELHTLYRVFTEAGGHWSTFIIWGKQTFTMGRSDYHRQFEPILYGWPEGKPHYWCGARDEADLWLIDRVHSNDLHPTMKPVELVARAIVNSSKRDGVVLDPFGGSGTTLVACEAKGRHARLIEVEPRYCDVIVKRWQDFAGRAAMHRSSGKTFAELAEQRQHVAIATGATFEQVRPQRHEKPRRPKLEISRKRSARRRRDELDRETNKAA